MDRLKYQIRVVRFLCLYAMFRLRLFKFSDLAYSDSHENEALDILTRHDSEKNAIPKVIWMYWDSPNPPDHIMAFHQKMKTINQAHEIILLDRNSLRKYLPTLHFDFQGIGLAHKSDVIRLALLKRYGGIWVDCSTLVYQDFSWVHERSGYDMVGYYSDANTQDARFPVIETWFMCAPPENPFVSRWLELIMPLTKISVDDYYNRIKERPDFERIKQGIPRGSYLTTNYLCQIAMREADSVNLYLKKCETSAFYYQNVFKWNCLKMSLFLLCTRQPTTHPKLIKLTNSDRQFLPLARKLRILDAESILGKLMLEQQHP